MTLLASHWISLGLALCLLYLPPLAWRADVASRLFAGCLAMLALVQLHVLLATLGMASAVAFALHEAALFGVAPLLYLGVESLRGTPVDRRRLAMHLSPVLLVLPLAVLQSLSPANAALLQRGLYFAAFAAGSVYMLGVYRHLGHFTHPARLVRLEAALLAMVTVTGTGVALLALLGELFAQPAFPVLYGSAITALMVLFHFLRLAYPDFTEVVADELREAAESADPEGRARRSRLTGIDIPERLAALRTLMERDALYRRDDLDLPTVADAVGLSTHQLSELVNEHLGQNFSRWLKQYRVAAAGRLLVEKPAMSVLEIGLTVGFNSLSAFYAAFREIEGMAPGMYRKQQRAARLDRAKPGESSPTP